MKSMSSDKILVVEDEWVVADHICRNLQDFGYTVCSTASTGDEARRKVKEHRPDLILMDIVLKGKMDGIEAADWITSQFDIPVIYLTAYTNQEYIERAKQTKPFGYLVKPIKGNELHTNIAMALHKHRVDKEIKGYLDLQELEERVEERTVDYQIINQALEQEIVGHKQAESQLEVALKARRESEQKYRDLSIIDELTQLYNSRHFYQQLKMEINRLDRHEHPLTLLLLDLDDFKSFNDTYGHIKGDQVLSRLGQVIKRCLRKADSAYRYGGEEFTIILPMTKSEEGIVTAERIKEELKKENFSPSLDKQVYLTVSTGVAQYRKQEDIKTFINRVDHLMYQAKKNGRDRICPES